MQSQYFTCIGKGHGAPAVPATREQWEAMRREPWLKQMCRRIENGDEALKSRLPIWTPSCAEFRGNHRAVKDALKPLPRLMLDFDQKGHSKEILAKAMQLMEAGKWDILLVEESVRRGTHVLITLPQGMTPQEAQGRFSADVGFQADPALKDVARCIYMVPEENVLYVSQTLFGPADPSPTLPQGEGVVTTDNGVDSHTPSPLRGTTPTLGVESVTTDLCPHQQDIILPSLVANGVPGGLTECQSVLHEGSNPHCDARTGQGGGSSLVSVLEDQLGGIPTHGSRNNFIFTMACHLRYVCNDDPEWIAQVLPTYGENREKWMATIRSACNRNQTPRMSRLMQRVLEICRERHGELEKQDEDPDLPPQMPRILPPLIRLLVSKTPDIYKPAVAHAVFPALAAHLWQTRFRYIDNVEHEATLMNVLMAGTGAGKNCISEPINRIMADIRQRDMDNLRREREWKKEVQSKGANKDKRQRPEGLVIQEIDPDMTNAAFVQRLADAEDRFLYTKMNEIDQFDALKGSARGKAQFQIMCLAFDPRNVYGQTRIGTGSVSERVSIRFNWNASTTVQKGRRYFSQVLTDGPISRINFCTIPEREIGADMPVYGTYDEAFDEELRPYIENLNKARGLIDCPKARTLAKRLIEECADFSRLSQSRVYENLSFRANVIAYLKAMVLFVASGGKWDKTVENFIRWSLQYDLWCKMRFFGNDIEMAESAHYASASKRGPQNLLDLLPDVFTREEVQLLRQKLGMERGSLKAMLSAWRQRGYIELYGKEMPHSELNQQRYEKTDFYLRNKSHAVNSKQ
ncbi:MAG: VirE protein [Bacteroidaceae bacterium]|nr:VirE protein [Bacteroidaceae bacterium]